MSPSLEIALRDAIFRNLGQFLYDDDCAEEAIFAAAIEQLGAALKDVRLDEETATFTGTADFSKFGAY